MHQPLLRQQAYVNGMWIDADNGAVSAICNPATGEILGHVPDLGAVETARAIEAAYAAGPAWRTLTAQARAQLLRRWFNLILEQQEALARLITLEQGKPLSEARGEVLYAASFIEWFAEEGRRVYGDVIPAPQADKRILVFKEPVGVCAAITAVHPTLVAAMNVYLRSQWAYAQPLPRGIFQRRCWHAKPLPL